MQCLTYTVICIPMCLDLYPVSDVHFMTSGGENCDGYVMWQLWLFLKSQAYYYFFDLT